MNLIRLDANIARDTAAFVGRAKVSERVKYLDRSAGPTASFSQMMGRLNVFEFGALDIFLLAVAMAMKTGYL